MSKTGSVQTITPGQMKELCSAASQSVPTDLPFTVADYWEHNKGELVRNFTGVLRSAPVASNLGSPVLAKIVSDCQRALHRMFGRYCPEVGPLPAIVTEERLTFWAGYNMHLIFLPELDLTENACLPKKWIRPEAWYYQKLLDGKTRETLRGVPPTRVRAGWYLADMSVGVDYTNGTQVFPNDPWSSLMEQLRTEGVVGKYDETPKGSRFAATWDEWNEAILAHMASDLGFPRANTFLEPASYFNAIGNIYDPNRGKFNMWVWFADSFEDSVRFVGGGRGLGGLAGVDCYWRGSRRRHVAARPLVVL